MSDWWLVYNINTEETVLVTAVDRADAVEEGRSMCGAEDSMDNWKATALLPAQVGDLELADPDDEPEGDLVARQDEGADDLDEVE